MNRFLYSFFLAACMMAAYHVGSAQQQPQYANFHSPNYSTTYPYGGPHLLYDTANRGMQFFVRCVPGASWIGTVTPSLYQPVSINRIYLFSNNEADTIIIYNLKFKLTQTAGAASFANPYTTPFYGNGFVTGMQQVFHRDTLMLTNVGSGTWIGFDLDSAYNLVSPTSYGGILVEMTRDSFRGDGIMLKPGAAGWLGVYGNPPYDSASTTIASISRVFGFDVDTFWNVAASSFVS
ncbi:MAG: hypothetical protein QM642_06035, partial [Edaphocola sp.]